MLSAKYISSFLRWILASTAHPRGCAHLAREVAAHDEARLVEREAPRGALGRVRAAPAAQREARGVERLGALRVPSPVTLF